MKELDSTAKQLLVYARQEWRMLALALVFFVLGGAVEPAIPALFKKLIDSGFKNQFDYPLWIVPVFIIGLFLTRASLNYCGTYLVQRAIGNIIFSFRLKLMAALLNASSDLFVRLSPGQIVNKIIHDPHGASQMLGGTLINLVKDAVVLLCLILYLIYLNWYLTVIAFICMPLLGIAVRQAQKRLDRVGLEQYKSLQRLTGIVDDNARAWRVVRSFGAAAFEFRRFQEEAERYRKLSNKQMATGALVTPVTQVVASLGVATIVTLALYQANQGVGTVGDFVSFVIALLMTISPLRHLSDVFQPVASALISARGAFELLSAPSEKDYGLKSIDQCRGDIKFSDVVVQFQGADHLALNGFNLHIRAATTVALVGASGAGKSTVINSLLRFVEIKSGEIQIDSISVSDLKLENLRSQFAVVSQDIVLFDGSFAENVAYARQQYIDRVRVKKCLLASNLWPYVESLKNGIDSSVGVNGSLLSGGQRQRLAIARALYKEAAIWIFDEATSSLDSESELVIQRAVDSLRHNKTIIIIAHRLSTIRNADLICVVSEGRIVEHGSHDELMNLHGRYAEMISLQHR